MGADGPAAGSAASVIDTDRYVLLSSRKEVPMQMKTIGGRDIELKPELLEGLKGRLRGSVILAGDDGYEGSRTVWNAMIDRRPAAVVRCLGTADVIAGVQFARDQRAPALHEGWRDTTSRASPPPMAR